MDPNETEVEVIGVLIVAETVAAVSAAAAASPVETAAVASKTSATAFSFILFNYLFALIFQIAFLSALGIDFILAKTFC